MASAPLIPQAFWFRLTLPCLRREALPRPGTNGLLLDLPGACALPGLAQLDGEAPWATVRAAWNPGGLGVAVEVTGKSGPVIRPDPGDPEHADRVELCLDTRDTRDIHRATRYCHRFVATLLPSGRGQSLNVDVEQRPIHRALADAPRVPVEAVHARAHRRRGGWLLELFLGAGALHGFDPETNRRLGFMLLVRDLDRGEQSLGVGREFPVVEDPSLWATLELRDAAP